METKDISPHIILQAGRAAKSALVQWYSGQWVRQAEELDDLTNELLVWYMTRAETRRKMEALSEPEIMVTFRIHAKELLSKATLEGNAFEGKALYSTESVKDALNGKSTNVYLRTILPLALKRINKVYREALQDRYAGDEPAYPESKEGQNALMNAHKALTREINVLYITQEVKGIGSSSIVFPDTIRPKGAYSDPTADTALALLNAHPDFADEYLDESPWDQVCKGADVEPVIVFGPSGEYRLTATEAALFKDVPGLIDLFIDQKQQDWKTK